MIPAFNSGWHALIFVLMIAAVLYGAYRAFTWWRKRNGDR